VNKTPINPKDVCTAERIYLPISVQKPNENSIVFLIGLIQNVD